MAVLYWMLSPGYVDHFSHPLTVEEARREHCPIPLPDSAHNIQFAIGYGGMQDYIILVRFEAPVDVCRSHVQTIVDAHAMLDKFATQDVSLKRITDTPLPIKNNLLGRATWFDVEKIRNGWTTANGFGHSVWLKEESKPTLNELIMRIRSRYPQVWIDEDRNIFYCEDNQDDIKY